MNECYVTARHPPLREQCTEIARMNLNCRGLIESGDRACIREKRLFFPILLAHCRRRVAR